MANDMDIAIFPNGAKTTACDPEGLCFGSDAKLANGGSLLTRGSWRIQAAAGTRLSSKLPGSRPSIARSTILIPTRRSRASRSRAP
jgi:hypothetical protein